MEKTAGRILKAEHVKFQGQYHLDIAQSPQDAKAGISRAPQTRILENSADYAVLEITCGCGTKTHVRCDYSNTKTT